MIRNRHLIYFHPPMKTEQQVKSQIFYHTNFVEELPSITAWVG